ncbi:MAG: protein-L-isoaspartate(D-aspartate) O-methyltransferase [Candidatus Omnitrophota bacterium]
MNDEILRRNMVEKQLVERGITDDRVLGAFRKIERHCFVPSVVAPGVYSDHPLPIGEGQTISQPYMAALMTQSLELRGGEKVLEIGTGSGFQSAVLAELGSRVYSIERIYGLLERAKTLFARLGYADIHLKAGDGSLGWPQEAPFSRIIVTAAVEALPAALTEQLAEGGIMVVPLGGNFSQVLTLFRKKGSVLESEAICPCVFVPLISGTQEAC